MSEFAGKEMEFAAGSLHGLRGWGMDELGRLHGVTHREVWRPGENVAVCKADSRVPCPAINKREEARLASEAGRQAVQPKKKKSKRNQPNIYVSLHTGSPSPFSIRQPCADPACVGGEYHTVEANHRFDPNCGCGFWAYDEVGFKPHGDVVGVIEAYGKTTIGTKGFRAEKARIVGLCKQDGEGKPLSRSVIARLSHLYPDALMCDDLDQMCIVFEGVLRQWGDVGEDFWLQSVKEQPSFGYSLGSVSFQYQPSFLHTWASL